MKQGGIDIVRLQEALERIASDLDQIEGREHLLLRRAAKHLYVSPSRSLDTCVSNFAFVVNSATGIKAVAVEPVAYPSRQRGGLIVKAQRKRSLPTHALGVPKRLRRARQIRPVRYCLAGLSFHALLNGAHRLVYETDQLSFVRLVKRLMQVREPADQPIDLPRQLLILRMMRS